jgi:hypothetical protein
VDDLAPVFGDLGEAEGFAEIDEVEDVLLEAGSAEADGGFEEFRADAGVGADGAGDFIDIGAGGFAEGGDRVDGGDALGEEGVGDEFGEFGGPEVGGDDALAGDPVGVDRDEGLTAAWPPGVVSPPMRMRSGFSRSAMAVPSARNSGLERT